ncbi:MAG: hypothetical protein MHM6MM_007870 [Cercozoa sp. M6MM]
MQVLGELASNLQGGVKSVRALVHKRRGALDYLKRVHAPQLCGQPPLWLNAIPLSPVELDQCLDDAGRRRAQTFFHLGTSLATLLDLPQGVAVVRALAQVLEEYEFFASSNSAMKLLRAKQLDARERVSVASLLSVNEPVRPTLRKAGRKVVYEFLDLSIPVPQHMSYSAIVGALCDTLSLLYAVFVDDTCTSATIADAIFKVDAKIVSTFLEPVTQHASAIAKNKVEGALQGVLEGSLSSSGQATGSASDEP